jgi:hypothetical protein
MMSMTTEANQRVRARAKYDLVKMMVRSGRATEADLKEAKEQVERWTEQVSKPIKQVESTKERGLYRSDINYGKSLSPDVKLIIDELEAKRTEVDNQKKVLMMALATIPENVLAKDEVNDILFLREKWQALSDKIRYVYQFEKLPETPIESIFDEHDFAKALPNNKYELDKEIKNLGANLSKYKARLQEAKTEVKRQKYETLIAQAELKKAVMQAKFNHL